MQPIASELPPAVNQSEATSDPGIGQKPGSEPTRTPTLQPVVNKVTVTA